MRTTITLDDDVAARLNAEARRSGRSFKDTVNAFLRRGLEARADRRGSKPFKVVARPLGPRPGVEYDNVGELLEQLEGPGHR